MVMGSSAREAKIGRQIYSSLCCRFMWACEIDWGATGVSRTWVYPCGYREKALIAQSGEGVVPAAKVSTPDGFGVIDLFSGSRKECNAFLFAGEGNRSLFPALIKCSFGSPVSAIDEIV